MATINIIRGLDTFTSANNQQSIKFDVLTGAVSVLVEIATVDFTPVKTATNVSGRDVYEIDLTNILNQLLPIAPDDSDLLTALTLSTSIKVKATGHTDNTITTILSYGYDEIGTSTLSDVYNTGRRVAVYHNGTIAFYLKNSAGAYDLTISGDVGVTYSYPLVQGWNVLVLDASQLINGALTIDTTDVSFDVTYIQPKYSGVIYWLDKDGGWSQWNFRKLSDGVTVKESKEIPMYYATHDEVKAKTRFIGKEKTVSKTFDTMCYNEDHFKQLMEIAESPSVIYQHRLWQVKDMPKQCAVYRQNLHFTLTLEADDYVASR